MHKHWIIMAALMLLATPALAQQQNYDQALTQARQQAHLHAEKLDKMTDAEWAAHKQAHPGRRPLQTLTQARWQAHKREARFDAMTPVQYQGWAMRHPKFGELSPAR